MTIEEYLLLRENLQSLNSKITDWAQDKFNFNNAAKLLGFIQNGILVFDDENDMDTLMEYLIFHSKYKGTPILDLFYDSDIVLEDTEERILEGIVNSKVHLLEVMDIDRNPDRCRVFMQDVFNSGTYEVINQGFSQSSYSGVLVGTSLIEIGHEIFMTSGSYFFSNRIERINYWQIIHSKNLNATENFPLRNYFCSVTRKTRNMERKYSHSSQNRFYR